MAVINTVAINRGGKRAVINASEYDKSSMKIWGEEEEKVDDDSNEENDSSNTDSDDDTITDAGTDLDDAGDDNKVEVPEVEEVPAETATKVKKVLKKKGK